MQRDTLQCTVTAKQTNSSQCATFYLVFLLPPLVSRRCSVPTLSLVWTATSLLLPVLCRIDRSGFLLASPSTDVTDTADGDEAAGLLWMTAGLFWRPAGLFWRPAGLAATNDLRRERCSTSFTNESSCLTLCIFDFLPYNNKQ